MLPHAELQLYDPPQVGFVQLWREMAVLRLSKRRKQFGMSASRREAVPAAWGGSVFVPALLQPDLLQLQRVRRRTFYGNAAQ